MWPGGGHRLDTKVSSYFKLQRENRWEYITGVLISIKIYIPGGFEEQSFFLKFGNFVEQLKYRLEGNDLSTYEHQFCHLLPM